ncbi:MAG: DUF368 domain-containing protein [Gammaproteobacteria bacterium]|nr:DUF368 domain-containing protein [Gammaproteobacteria bacterium]
MSDQSSESGSDSLKSIGSLVLVLKGMAMGLGDSVPGISGGTIAVITNIYERLIFAIRAVDKTAIKYFARGEFRKFWQHIDGNFLLLLALGVLAGLLISANTVLFMLDNYFEPLMAFFVGLVLASTWVLRTQYSRQQATVWILLMCGFLFTLYVGNLEPRIADVSLVYVFICGGIGICAMILPGLSGAFILLLLGIYQFMLKALVDFNFLYIAVFLGGCVIGLLAFSRILAWLLRHYHDLSFGFITGMLLGSIYVLWPWQQVISFYEDSAGVQHPLQTVKIWPLNYTEITGNSPWLGVALIAFIAGAALVLVLSLFFNKKNGSSVQE